MTDAEQGQPRASDTGGPVDAEAERADIARWRRAATIVDRAMECDVAARAQMVRDACEGDEALHRVVLEWLAAVDAPGTLLDHPFWPANSIDRRGLIDAPTALSPGTMVGAWRLVRVIGAGGMGTVYEAERADGAFERRVALKVVRATSGHAWFAARLQRERQLLARLDHPNIARLLDGGVLADGTPFYAMELVDGSPIDVWCDTRNLDVVARLRLFRQACAAVAYAHRQLVVHRDLKPSNILVNADGVVKVVDFGIAQSLSEHLDNNEARAGTSTTTDASRNIVLGAASSSTEQRTRSETWPALSPAYASPEQFAGIPTSALSDVYSLTAVLYALVAGVSPHHRLDLTASTIALDVWPEFAPLASTALPRDPATASSIAARRATTPDRLARLLRGDVDAILVRGLARDPERRYASIDAIDADVANVLATRPVSARQSSWQRRTWMYARRNTTAVVAAGAAVIGLITTTGTALRQAQRAEQSRQRVAAVNSFLLDMLSLPYPYDSGATRQVSMRTLLDSARSRSAELVEAADTAGTELLLALAKGYTGLGDFRSAADLSRQALGLSLSGGQSTNVAALRFRLAELLLRSGDAAAARAEMDTADAIFRVEAGTDSLALAVFLQQRGRTLRELGQLAAAEQSVRESIALFERVPGGLRRTPYTNALQTLGHIFLDRADYAEAERAYRKAYDQRRRITSGAIEIANVQSDIAAAAMAQGKLALADSLLTASSSVKRAQLSPMDGEIIDDDVKWAQLALRRGEFARAERTLREAQTQYAAAGPIPPWRLAPLLEALAVARLAQRDGDESALLAEAGIATTARVSSAPSALRAALFAVWRDADLARGKSRAAESHARRCRADIQQLRPMDSAAVDRACAVQYFTATAPATMVGKAPPTTGRS
ncbi:MAG: serine/threonine protein kinase [Gemmatimonadaceae bacterium]|nr:serine/threonine protein kinase [Gemmatimonadaceae bacterium]